MSFGKPKNPLLELVNPAHAEFHINKLEANMRGEPYLAKCGCSFQYTGVNRGRVLKRCPQHAGHVDENIPESLEPVKDSDG